MEHLAILSKKLKLLNKIISGEKKIESRWYKFKKPPIGCISRGDVIYFKESGEKISVKAEVENVLIFKELTQEKIKEILKKYGKSICVDTSYIEKIKDKKFCALIFLCNVQKIEPFEINKKGYGMMSAWVSIENIEKIKKK